MSQEILDLTIEVNSQTEPEKITKVLNSSILDNWSGENFPWSKEIEKIKTHCFNILEPFRENQKEAINAILSHRDCFVIMPTGGGKSLCYQIPALVSQGLTLVISPLLSLIRDQMMGLTFHKISASLLTGGLPKKQMQKVYENLFHSEKGNTCLVYVTPEFIKGKYFLTKLEELNKMGMFHRIIVDEAHCCSRQGHDFRPDYRSIKCLRHMFPDIPIMALTATATSEVQLDVKRILGIENCILFKSSFNRPNLFFEVRQKSLNRKKLIEQVYSFIVQNYPNDSGIIYCLSKKDTKQIALDLSEKGINAVSFHDELNDARKSLFHERWIQNKIQVIVATAGFGLGIDKPNVRFVIHHSISKSVMGYYQEIGRAGRDGAPAHCLLYYRGSDLTRLSVVAFDEPNGLKNLYSMLKYCETRTCRRETLAKVFEEDSLSKACISQCNNCANPTKHMKMDLTSLANSVVKIIDDLDSRKESVTMLQFVAIARGKRKRNLEINLSPELKRLSKNNCERLIVNLLLEEILKEELDPKVVKCYLKKGRKASTTYSGLNNFMICQTKKFKIESSQSVILIEDDDLVDNLLYQDLENLRNALAAEAGVLPHFIFSTLEIEGLAKIKPKDEQQLSNVLSPGKISRYGKQILATMSFNR